MVGGQESDYWTLMPRGAGSHRHGASAGATRVAARITSQLSGSGPLGSCPMLLAGTNASPARSPLPDGCDGHNRGCHERARGWADSDGSTLHGRTKVIALLRDGLIYQCYGRHHLDGPMVRACDRPSRAHWHR